ncbi:MAG TPA: alpha/beta fold hydrolase [Planktothrix sp.]|jgi:hypothetical protein
MLSCSAGLSSPLYTHFLFFPQKEIRTTPEEIGGIARQDVTISVGKSKIYGWYFKNPASPYVVLVSHGNGGNIGSVRWIANNLISAGASVLLYDYRGYGMSDGHPTVESICGDGDAAYTYLTKTAGYTPDKVIVYGQSLGCAVACSVADKHQVAGMILQSGFSSLRHVAFQHFPILQHAPMLVPNALDNASILGRCNAPLLVIHGDDDKVVPFDNGEELFKAASGTKYMVVCHNSGHRLFPESNEQHRDAVQTFIKEIMSGAPPSVKVSHTELPSHG